MDAGPGRTLYRIFTEEERERILRMKAELEAGGGVDRELALRIEEAELEVGEE